MNIQVNFSKVFVTNFFLVLIAILFTVERVTLYTDFTELWISITQIILFFSFLFGLVFLAAQLNDLEKIDNGRLVQLLIVLLLSFISLFMFIKSSSPTFYTKSEVKAKNEVIEDAIEEGFKISDRARDNGDFEDELEAVQDSVFKDNPEAQDVVERTARESKETDKSKREIIEEVNPVVGIILNDWNCESPGCTFGTFKGVWMISLDKKIVSAIAVFINLMFIIWVVNKSKLDIKRK